LFVKNCIRWSAPLFPYHTAWELQKRRVERIATKEARPTVFFLEHPPVVTIGKSGKEENLLFSEATLKEKGVECVRIDRGGDVTFHGPGQLVVYLMLPLTGGDRDAHGFLRRLEKVGIMVLQDYGIEGRRSAGFTGVWVGEKKIMAIGVKIKKWVTYHGLAFNYQNDLKGFNLIVPCGIKDKGVTSLHRLIQTTVTRREIEDCFVYHIEQEFGVKLLPPVDPRNPEILKEN